MPTTLRRLSAALSLAVVASVTVAASPVGADTGPVRLLVTSEASADDGFALAGVPGAERVGPADAATADAATGDAPFGVDVLEVRDHPTAVTVAAALRSRPGVLAVEEDVRLHPQSTAAWGIHNTGQAVQGIPGVRGVDIGAHQARPHATGAGSVVAVIDSGVDLDHPLLHGRFWVNPGESANGRDSDGNGYVDDVHGWDFTRNTPDVSIRNPRDVHATHVAGIIAGGHHADSGFRGVAPDAEVMVLRFVDDDGSGWASNAILALRYAADNGADVVNLSFGGREPSTALRAAIAATGLPVITSAGNEGVSHTTTPIYPAADDIVNQLTVAAVDHAGALASFSSFGRRTVDVAAPGHRIVSTVPGARLASMSGTSMAAPFVAGAVALAVQRSPGASTAELLDAVRRSARPLPGASETVTGAIPRAGGLLAAVGGPVPVCRSSTDVAFADVDAAHTHHRGVGCLVATGVTNGVTPTRFGAELGLTRAQVATLVANALDEAGLRPATPSVGSFDDLEGNVHRDNVEALAAVGIVRGDAGSSAYRPTAVVSRGEFAGVVARAAEHVAGAKARVAGPVFDDIAGSVDRDGITSASALSLVNGRRPGVFDPDADVRRDQAATMLVHLLDRLHHQGFLEAR